MSWKARVAETSSSSARHFEGRSRTFMPIDSHPTASAFDAQGRGAAPRVGESSHQDHAVWCQCLRTSSSATRCARVGGPSCSQSGRCAPSQFRPHRYLTLGMWPHAPEPRPAGVAEDGHDYWACTSASRLSMILSKMPSMRVLDFSKSRSVEISFRTPKRREDHDPSAGV